MASPVRASSRGAEGLVNQGAFLTSLKPISGFLRMRSPMPMISSARLSIASKMRRFNSSFVIAWSLLFLSWFSHRLRHSSSSPRARRARRARRPLILDRRKGGGRARRVESAKR